VASDELSIDVLIFGGGIAGLWTLARLRGEGYSCVLVERDALGGGQTIASQGIIHGGIKYALTGRASRASAAIAGMPGIWAACLSGTGEVDLRASRVLSERQYLWTTAGIGSRLVGAAVGRVIRTPVGRVAPGARPECFADASRGVDVYSVEERVLEPRSVVHALAEQAGGAIVRCDWSLDGGAVRLAGVLGEARVSPRWIVLCAGEGNAHLMDALKAGGRGNVGPRALGQQRRPLHMVMVRGDLPEVFGHCVGMTDRPRLTITSQIDAQGRTVWYVGGEVAEAGVAREAPDQIAAARREIGACMPWIDLSGTKWSSVRVNRAEGTIGEAKNQRPDEPVVIDLGGEPGVIAAYPTKLAFAPMLAAKVVEAVRAEDHPPSLAAQPTGSGQGHALEKALAGFARPPIAALPWEREGVVWS
jgi:glycerol-3-phosphate dehydrogenase